MEEGNRGSAALLFPDPSPATGTSIPVSAALTFNEVGAIDMAVFKVLVEWDKLHQKVPATSQQPNSPIATNSSVVNPAHTLEGLISLASKDALKDRIKFCKYLSKVVPAIVGCPAALNSVVAGTLLSAHWKTVGETLVICAARKVEAAFVKDTKNWAILLVAELFKFGPKPGLRHLLFGIILVELEEKEGLHLLGLTAPKLLEAKFELENLVHTDVEGFLASKPTQLTQSFTGPNAKTKPRMSMFRGQLTDTRLALYLMFAGNELQSSSEIFLLLDQIAKYTALSILVATCKKWREAIIKGQTNIKLSIDVCVVLVLKQLFSSTSLHMLTSHESLLLKCIFCLTLRDNSWFWDKIEALYIGYPDGISLSPEELNLLLTLNTKLVRKLGKVCFSKTNEYKSTKSKIVQHLDKSLPEIFVRATKDTLQDKFQQACGSTLEELATTLHLGSLFVQPATIACIDTALIDVVKSVIESDQVQQLGADLASLVSYSCLLHQNSEALRPITRLFYVLLQTRLEDPQPLSQRTVRSSLQTLKAFHRVFSPLVMGGAMLYPMVLSLVVKVAQHSSDKKEFSDSDGLHLLRVSRHILEYCRLQPAWPLAQSAWNPSHRTLGPLADAYTPLIIRSACQFLRLDSSASAKPSDPVALEVCLLLRSLSNHLLADSFRSKVADSVHEAQLTNLLYLQQLATPDCMMTTANFEDVAVLECFGVDTLSCFLQSARLHQATTPDASTNLHQLPELATHLEDKRLLDLYRTSQLPPRAPASQPQTPPPPTIPTTSTTTQTQPPSPTSTNTTNPHTAAELHLSDGFSLLQVDVARSLLRLRTAKGLFEYRVSADRHSLANFLAANGWLSPEVLVLRDREKKERELAAVVGVLDERDSLVPVRVGLFVLPPRASFLACPATNEDLERLVVKQSQEPLTEELTEIIAAMIDSPLTEVLYRNNMVTNHVVRASLMVAALYQEQKDRSFELKKELGTCEVNVYLDPDNLGHCVGEQFLKSGQTFVEIVASRLSTDYWSVTLKPHPALADELQRQRSRAHESWNSRSEGDQFGILEFSDYWLSGLSQQRTLPQIPVHKQDLPKLLKSLSIFYSLAVKATSGSLRSPSATRRAKLTEICSKYGGIDKSSDVLELLQSLLIVNN